jgi:hypothetical protein
MPNKWLPAVVAVLVVAVGFLIFNIVRSSRHTPSGVEAPAKPKMQGEAMRRLRMGAGRPGGIQQH